MVKEDLEFEAIKKGSVDGGGDITGLTRDQIYEAWDQVVDYVTSGSVTDGPIMSIYNHVNSNLDKVPMESHFQALPLGLTIAAVAVLGIVWFLLYRHAKKMA